MPSPGRTTFPKLVIQFYSNVMYSLNKKCDDRSGIRTHETCVADLKPASFNHSDILPKAENLRFSAPLPFVGRGFL